MAVNRKRAWIVAYDIADPRRLQQVHSFMVKHAYALQYSVFLALSTDRELDRLLAGLEQQISRKHDDVRAYPLPEGAEPVCLGQMRTSDFLLLSSLSPECVARFVRGGSGSDGIGVQATEPAVLIEDDRDDGRGGE